MSNNKALAPIIHNVIWFEVAPQTGYPGLQSCMDVLQWGAALGWEGMDMVLLEEVPGVPLHGNKTRYLSR